MLRVPKCEGCPFKSIHTVGAFGPTDSPFVVVGESPGKEENRVGRPFIGQSGAVLDAALSRAGPHPEPYRTNAFKCMPITGRTKKKEEEHVHAACYACAENFKAELDSRKVKPRIILAVGNGALWQVTGDHSHKISRARGRLYPTPYAEIGVVAALHPAALLRGFGSWRQFQADVELAVDLVNLKEYHQPGTANLHVLQTSSEIDTLAQRFKALPAGHPIAADDETGGFNYQKYRIISQGFTDNGHDIFIIPREVPGSRDPLYDNSCHYVWHNGKFDLHFEHNDPVGARSARIDEDTLLESYALDERRGIHDLGQVAKDWLNSPDWKHELDKHKKKKESYEVIPRDVLYKYQSFDIANTWHIHQILRPQIKRDPDVEKLYTRTLIPASRTLGRIEENGITIDIDAVRANEGPYQDECDAAEAELNRIAIDLRGRGVNPNSPIQLCELLYDKFLGEPPIQVGFGIKPYKGERSTDADHLKEIKPTTADAKRAVDALKAYRKPAKAKSTYVSPYLPTFRIVQEDGTITEEVNEDCIIWPDGKVHTTFLIHGTPTGRLSSNDPNTQNIPRDPRIRSQFIAKPGRRLIEVDLNQAELRSLACLSQDPFLCHIYETEGMSLHEVQRAASYGDPKDWSSLQIEQYLTMFGLTHATRYTSKGKDRILEEQKMRAKAVNFGIVYGRTAQSLAEEFHTSVEEAQRWIEAWFGRFPQARMFIEVCRQAPRLGKDLITVFGRRKRHGIVAPQILTSLENEAANMPHQSIASDINLHGAIEMEEQLKDEMDTNIINLVHDSNLMDAPDDDAIAAKVIQFSTSVLSQVPPKWGLNRIKFKADAKMGYKWGALSEDDVTRVLKEAA